MDAKGEVSPRSFLRALAEAAKYTPAPRKSSIDAAGIREGIKAASRVRLDQLSEDYLWAKVVLEPLADQRVPCEARDFAKRWRDAETVDRISQDASLRGYLGPVELAVDKKRDAEATLLNALIRLGIVERRDDGRINMPDIYRVAAKLLRKGGVPPRRA
jgi:hypothetical protein